MSALSHLDFMRLVVEGCALTLPPGITPERLSVYADVESARNPVALNVNGTGGGSVASPDLASATAKAERLVGAGRSVDLGVMQVNSQWLSRFGVSVAQAMQPCRNLSMGAAILADADRQSACIYNTGRPGCRNGYDLRIQAASARLGSQPASVAPVPPTVAPPAAIEAPAVIGPCGPPPPSWDGWALQAHEACVRRVASAPRLPSAEGTIPPAVAPLPPSPEFP